ncbi:hypothetical protein GCM10010411_37640 [Actinomadura fulvescens]|uniref:Uncharacterized protein n=1 Tax=Actinomadura fulvescens TaxID=46160 RepID=A0ABP6C3E9_9ACTN
MKRGIRAVYVKLSVSTFLIFAGIITPPAATPAARVARILLQVTGVGFGVYCVAAIGLFLVGVCVRVRGRPTGVAADRPAAEEGP